MHAIKYAIHVQASQKMNAYPVVEYYFSVIILALYFVMKLDNIKTYLIIAVIIVIQAAFLVMGLHFKIALHVISQHITQ